MGFNSGFKVLMENETKTNWEQDVLYTTE